MDYRRFLQKDDDRIVAPFLGGRRIVASGRVFRLVGDLPPEPGWYSYEIRGRRVEVADLANDPLMEMDLPTFSGHVVGNVIVARDGQVEIHLVPEGMERFATVEACVWPDGNVIFKGFGMDDEGVFIAREVFEDKGDLSRHAGIAPELRHAFAMECMRRAAEEAEERRRIAEAAAAERQRLLEEYRKTLKGSLEYALQQSGAHLLDWREMPGNRLSVRYTMAGLVGRYNRDVERLECIIDRDTFRVIDSGICLDDHRGTRGDDRFTLQSLPSVVREAVNSGQLVVTRY